jgi:hypothetical protein
MDNGQQSKEGSEDKKEAEPEGSGANKAVKSFFSARRAATHPIP